MKLSGHVALKLGLLGLAIGYLITAWQIPMDPWTAQELVNARTLPLLYGAALILALLLSWRQQTAAPEIDAGRLLRMAGVAVLILGFLLLLEIVNLWLGLGFLLITLALWLGERRVIPIAALAISVPLIGWAGIELLLELHLPE